LHAAAAPYVGVDPRHHLRHPQDRFPSEYGLLARSRFCRRFAGRRHGLVDKIDRRALAHAPSKIVPTGQPDAAVRIALADPRPIGRVVNAVALVGEMDPHHPGGILGARRDRQLAIGVNVLELEFWM
jgi:hypothetical protein